MKPSARDYRRPRPTTRGRLGRLALAAVMVMIGCGGAQVSRSGKARPAEKRAKIHAAGKEYTLETLASGCVIPPHPGSLRFFKEHHIEVQPVIK